MALMWVAVWMYVPYSDPADRHGEMSWLIYSDMETCERYRPIIELKKLGEGAWKVETGCKSIR